MVMSISLPVSQKVINFLITYSQSARSLIQVHGVMLPLQAEYRWWSLHSTVHCFLKWYGPIFLSYTLPEVVIWTIQRTTHVEHISSFTIQLLSTSEPQHSSMWLKFSFQFNSCMLTEWKISSRWYSSLVINRLTIECVRSSFCIHGASPMNGDFHFCSWHFRCCP